MIQVTKQNENGLWRGEIVGSQPKKVCRVWSSLLSCRYTYVQVDIKFSFSYSFFLLARLFLPLMHPIDRRDTFPLHWSSYWIRQHTMMTLPRSKRGSILRWMPSTAPIEKKKKVQEVQHVGMEKD